MNIYSLLSRAFTLNCSIFPEAHIWMERLSSAFINIKTVLSRLLKRFFTLDTQHAHGTSFDSFEKILVPISSHNHSFCIFIELFNITYFRQHLHNLISEGKTNLWAEYNDWCVQRSDIHSLLFVIYLLNNFHIFAE